MAISAKGYSNLVKTMVKDSGKNVISSNVMSAFSGMSGASKALTTAAPRAMAKVAPKAMTKTSGGGGIGNVIRGVATDTGGGGALIKAPNRGWTYGGSKGGAIVKKSPAELMRSVSGIRKATPSPSDTEAMILAAGIGIGVLGSSAIDSIRRDEIGGRPY